jgi:hypothetical protein
LQLLPSARGGAQDRIDDGALAFRSDLDRFVDGSVFRRLGDEYLIKAQAQKIAKIDIYVSASERSDPKIEQGEVSQDAVEKLDRECAISRLKRDLGERARNDCVRELLFSPPGSQRGESDSASRVLRHENFSVEGRWRGRWNDNGSRARPWSPGSTGFSRRI